MRTPRPWLWRQLWGFCIAAIVVVAIIQYFYQGFLLGTVLEGVALVSALTAISYYIRVRPWLNRAAYILLGVTPIGLLIFLAFGAAFSKTMISYLGPWPSLVIDFTLPFIIGPFIGDWIGKRLNYRIPW